MLIIYIVSGLVGVINMILWGLYGDLLAEKFEPKKVLRSVLLAVIFSTSIFLINPDLPLFIVALITIALERASTEIYKALIRKEDQSKYLIPSDLNLKTPYYIKRPLGVVLIIGMVVLLYVLDFQVNNLVLGLLMGIGAALGGAAKDAPYEGFDFIKFWRSPIVGIAVAILLYLSFPDLESKFFLYAVPGGERIISEFYKKIYKGNIPGKFKEESKTNTQWLKERSKLLYLYAMNIIVLAVIYLFSLTQ